VLSAEANSAGQAAEDRRGQRAPARVGLALLGMLVAFLALHVAMDQRTPYTSEAALQAPVIGIAPNVSGDIVEVGVRDNQRVVAGDLIFQIDPSAFTAALRQAEAELENVVQQLGADYVGLGGAEAAVVEARARLVDVEAANLRAEALLERGFVAQAAVDNSRADLAAARSAVRSSEAELEEARRRLGPLSEDNPQVRAALAARERAQIDLRHARVVAPVDGAVTNTVLSVGQFARAGDHMATIIDTASAWIVAQVPENALGGIASGDRVDVVLDVAPGRIFEGRVESVASGVEHTVAAGLQGDLPTPVDRRVWLRDVQRIPVRIDLVGLDPSIPIRAGARASVAIHTADAGFMGPVARAWMWTVAYVRFAF
jgi:multidrug resistance efflux pump